MVVAKEHVTRRLNAGAAPKENRVLTYLLEKNCYVTVEMRRHDRSECARIGEASPSLKATNMALPVTLLRFVAKVVGRREKVFKIAQKCSFRDA